ncbi:hypothetical protein TNCV_2585061 [Trichonephila clavipes]|nr:hypothetical protein TNCV_2585061 [Trichonephila clavipes]
MSSCRSLIVEGGIIGMMEAGWSARREAHQLGRSDCVVKCWNQWIREMSFTRRPGSENSLCRSVVENPTAS